MENLIQTQLFRFGFLPLLIVVERMAKMQDYEMCKLIVDVITEHNKKFDISLPTKFGVEAVVEMKLAFMTNFNLMGDIAYANSEYYADEIIDAILTYKENN